MEKYCFIFLIFINALTFILYGVDKYNAIHKNRRISEKTLLLFSFLFGSFGALAGIYIFRHKTRKTKFRILVPIFLLIHIYFIMIF